MTITEMETALRSAQSELDRADFVATQMAKLKAELRSFNGTSRTWTAS